jgi:hypothetical protein
MALVAHFVLELHQMDVKTVFFMTGSLYEDVCIVQPNGFVASGKEHMVSNLRNPFMGLNKFCGSGT